MRELARRIVHLEAARAACEEEQQRAAVGTLTDDELLELLDLTGPVLQGIATPEDEERACYLIATAYDRCRKEATPCG